MLNDLLERAAALLRSARYAIALTGAGVSTSSGIPDFRSPASGLWESADPMVVASLPGFQRHPEAFFRWIRPLARLMVEAQPNAAHLALADLERRSILRAVITQNIDMLHTRAGAEHVVELHGSFQEATCMACYRVYPVGQFIHHFIETGETPRCEHCGGVLKPNVILFGEQLPFRALQVAQRTVRECDVMLVAGSSLEVAPASDLPMLASECGAKIIMLNYEATYMDRHASLVIHDDVAEILPRLAMLV
ncbi:MAG: NAD-dependent deacylase [Anaerolineae bacterium]|nr:NAD-dependent deacylase [Anaerolineae bacterium]